MIDTVRRRMKEFLLQGMGTECDDAVTIKVEKRSGEPSKVTVNCPDKTGLACDLCRIILEFGLRITRGDISTDGRWCYVVIWVLPQCPSAIIWWDSLKARLLTLCPSFYLSTYYNLKSKPRENPVYLLKFFCQTDRKGLLHDVTHVLCELQLLIHKVNVSTTPDRKVVDFFFITDGEERMHTKERQEETISRLNDVLGESGVHCELQLAGSVYESFRKGSFSSTILKELFSSEIAKDGTQLQVPQAGKFRKTSVNIDNFLSAAHTLLQIHCLDQKGLLYDILRALKDSNVQISYGRFRSDTEGFRDVDIFIQQSDGRKLVDPQKQELICSRLRTEILHPLRMLVINRGPDMELLVASPLELCGKGRPRVFYDVTLALKSLGICIFSAEICRHSTGERQWEVYRFLLDDSTELRLESGKSSDQIVEAVRKTLMGW